jgi:pantoate--beta-alanine ligase
MIVFDAPVAMQEWTRSQRARGNRVGLVPTMGALHAGHLALIGVAASRADAVVVSIFVNPLQFNRRDDFELYPRVMDTDLDHCRDRGVAAVYAPSQAVMYPPNFQTHVEPGVLAEPLEGAGRPGHFRGVTTVVAKLFNAVQPDFAVFGQKDYQQLAIVRRMVADLDMGIEIVAVPTVREEDGLALSSRNSRLTAEQRRAAVVVPAALAAIEDAARSGITDSVKLIELATARVDSEPLARLEYIDLVDPETLERRDTIAGGTLAVTAIWFGDVRLIDNRIIAAPN